MSENYRNELALLDLKDAFKLAFQRSGKTQTTVAREMGWTMHNVQHVFGLNDHLPVTFPNSAKCWGMKSFWSACTARPGGGNRMPLRRLTVPRL